MRILRGSARIVAQTLIEIVGWLVAIAGIAMLVLPGPGILGVFLGVVILSHRYQWARNLRHRSREWVDESTRTSVATNTRIAFSGLMITLIIACSIFVYNETVLPFGIEFEFWGLQIGPTIPGNSTVIGATMFASAMIALALLIYGVFTYRGKRYKPEENAIANTQP